jgi:glycosyltransferase involved in cell wall biosynthesis
MKNNNKTMSVVIPYYNDTNTISDTVFSAIKALEFLEEYEIIIVDDGSKHQPPTDLISKNKIKYLRIDNAGVANARNIGASIARFSYIAFLDADDQWRNDKISLQLGLIDSLGFKFIGSNSTRISYPSFQEYFKIKWQILPFKWSPHISTVIIEKKYFFDIGGFDSTMRYAEDGDFFMRVAKDNNLYVVNKDLAKIASQKNCNYNSGLSSQLKKMYLGELSIVNSYMPLYLRIFYWPIIYLKLKLRYINRRLSS